MEELPRRRPARARYSSDGYRRARVAPPNGEERAAPRAEQSRLREDDKFAHQGGHRVQPKAHAFG